MCLWLGETKEALKELPSAIKMPYVSIDLETTGLDADTCQILEIGAIYDDGTKYVDDLPIYHKYVYHPLYTGEPYALALNAKILKRLSSISAADLQNGCFLRPDQVAGDFRHWLTGLGWDGKTCLTPAARTLVVRQELPRQAARLERDHQAEPPRDRPGRVLLEAGRRRAAARQPRVYATAPA